jgi:hypothetical protein
MDASRLFAIALAAPGCILAGATAFGLAMTVVDQSPMWPHQPVNLSEAAGSRDESELVRLIEDGVDPNARYPVRAGLIFGYPTRLTPLEAAVANDDPAVLTQLLAKGAAMTGPVWTQLRCIAKGERVPPVLDRLEPAGASRSCDGVVEPWARDGTIQP